MTRRFHLFAAVLAAVLLVAGPAPAAIDIQPVKTPGGLTVWLMEDHTNPIVSVEFSFRGGSALDPAGKEGLANMASATMDEGAADLDSQAFQQTLEDKAIRIKFNAGMDTFGGSLQTLTRNRDEAFQLLRKALTAPRFDAEPLERIRSQILVGLKRDEEDPQSLAGDAMRDVLYGDHPYGRNADGTPDSVKAITADDLKGFVARRLARDNLVIGVVGDVDAKTVAAAVDAAFGALPAKATPWALQKIRANTDGRTIVIDRDIPQSAIFFADQGLKRPDPDFYAAYVMNHILGGGGFTSRLYREIREKKGLAYSVSTGLHPRDYSATLVGGAGTANARVKETLDILKAEWHRMAEAGVTDEELNDAKTYLTGAYPLRFSSSSRIARMLVGLQLDDLGIDYVKKRNGYIEAVTRDDIARVAKKLLDPKRLVTVVVGRPEGVASTN
ncbi:MAG: pitrilysin family protein [Rhodospirillaceae bacterium]